MSEPKRYECNNTVLAGTKIALLYDSQMYDAPNGEYVSYYDYARLKAEVERLTKAGDAMAAHIERNDERCYEVIPDGDIRISEWNAAKEGKPRA